MTYGSVDVGPNRGPNPTWFFVVRDTATGASPVKISFSGTHAQEESLTATEALFQKLITAIEADTDLYIVSASRTHSGTQPVTP